MECSFKKFFEGHQYEVGDSMNLSNGIIKKMLDGKILTPRQHAVVEANSTVHEKIDKMIEILLRRPNEYVGKFCEMLIEDEQKNIVELCYPEYLRVHSSENEPQRSDKKRKILIEVNNEDWQDEKKSKNEQLVNIEDECDFPEIKFVDVKKTTLDFYQKHSGKAYDLSSARRGVVCIINIMKTSGMSDRRGTEVDSHNLEKLFRQMHFTVQVYNDDDDLSAKGVIGKIKDSARENGECFLLFILSHGGVEIINKVKEEVVYGTDGKPVSKKRILEELKDTSCPHLIGKPRIVFFQSCRGELVGYTEETDGNTEETDNPSAKTQAHFLVCYPCEPDFVSMRHPQMGSRYVRCLVDVFMKEAHCSNILTLLTMVNDRLQKLVTSDKRHQVADLSSTLLKEFYFFPGIVDRILE